MRNRCWDPEEGEWEWENMYENDGTLDGSLLTSIETDGLAGTSYSNHNIVVAAPEYQNDASFQDQYGEDDEIKTSLASENYQSQAQDEIERRGCEGIDPYDRVSFLSEEKSALDSDWE